MARAVAAAGGVREVHLADLGEQRAMVDDPVADDVDYLPLLLNPAIHPDHRRRHDGAALRLEPVRPEDAVGDAGLVLDGDEQHALGAARLLADKDDPRALDMAAVPDVGEVGTTGDAAARELLPQKGERMRAERQLERAIIFHHLAPLGQRA
ncbi:hypothetical protein F4693_002189 [Sphingomonas endophytica]|uniref:Uncharacterized protein n=1 Tax=Sphingomonas endophytica TaxID=869719 RepID=A0A7X0MN08_9SPHN|nr:hypothetical protein [Sphingomonas endophytica]